MSHPALTLRLLAAAAALLLPTGALAGSDFCAGWDGLSLASKDEWLVLSDVKAWRELEAALPRTALRGDDEAAAELRACIDAGRPALRASLDQGCAQPSGLSDSALLELLGARVAPCFEAAEARVAEREAAREDGAIKAGLEERARRRRDQADAELAALRQAEVICRGRAAQVPLVDPGPYPTPDGDLGAGVARGTAWGSAIGSNLVRQRQAFEGCMAELGFVER